MNSVEKSAKKIESIGAKIGLGGHTKADATAFAVVEIIFMGLVMVTAVVFIAYQTAEPILTNLMQGAGVSPAQIQAQQGLGGNIYSWDVYLPLIFYFICLAIIFSTIFLNADPISWLLSILFCIINFYLAAWISNISKMMLSQAVLASGVSHLPASLSILANLSTITLLFSIVYVICLALRIWFFNNSGVARPASGGGIV